MDEITKLVTNVGFPIAVSVYLLVRFESKVDKLSSCITNLSNIIEKHFSSDKAA